MGKGSEEASTKAEDLAGETEEPEAERGALGHGLDPAGPTQPSRPEPRVHVAPNAEEPVGEGTRSSTKGHTWWP